MMTDNIDTDLDIQTADQIESYLKNNPTFFLERDQLLTELYLPHASGGAVSLLEKQVNLLRERNIESRKRLNQFVSKARDNDELFDKTQTIILAMLEAKSLPELLKNFTQYALNSFNIDAAEITLLGDNYHSVTGFSQQSLNAINQNLPWLKSIKGCIGGHFREEELKVLFPSGREMASAIVLPLRHKQELIAMVCFGSKDSDYFKVNMDTLFIEFIAAVFSRCIARFQSHQ